MPAAELAADQGAGAQLGDRCRCEHPAPAFEEDADRQLEHARDIGAGRVRLEQPAGAGLSSSAISLGCRRRIAAPWSTPATTPPETKVKALRRCPSSSH